MILPIIERAERAAVEALKELDAAGPTDSQAGDERLGRIARELNTIRAALAELRDWKPLGVAGIPGAYVPDTIRVAGHQVIVQPLEPLNITAPPDWNEYDRYCGAHGPGGQPLEYAAWVAAGKPLGPAVPPVVAPVPSPDEKLAVMSRRLGRKAPRGTRERARQTQASLDASLARDAAGGQPVRLRGRAFTAYHRAGGRLPWGEWIKAGKPASD